MVKSSLKNLGAAHRTWSWRVALLRALFTEAVVLEEGEEEGRLVGVEVEGLGVKGEVPIEEGEEELFGAAGPRGAGRAPGPA